MSDESFLAAARCEPLRVYGSSRCECSLVAHDTKMAVLSGLRVVRLRYGLPYSELPDAVADRLSDYLLYLLAQGKVRTAVSFPRRQGLPDGNGLVSLVRLGRKERWELAHTLNSFKRNLPTGCRLHTPSKAKDWASKAFSQPPPTSPEYLRFVRSEVTRLFPSGWDSRYVQNVRSFAPTASAREFASPDASCPGASGIWRTLGREEFLNRCLVEGQCSTDLTARYKEVLSAGKVRPLTIFSHEVDELGPLHRTLYDFLSGKPWLLRGSPSAEKMASICTGRVQTSVDLVNATDGLRHDVAETILDSLFFSSLSVPRSLRLLAKRSLSPLVCLKSLFGASFNGQRRRVRCGQMMGAYLSFPLLCIQSYVAARWAARFDKNARFLVNGDDCVISASRAVLSEDYPSFFELNTKKTIRAENVVEVNSTVFLRMRGKWVRVNHLRRGTLLPGYAGALHLAKACAGSPAWTEAYVKARLSRKWGFLPSQVGLHRSSRSAWRREVSMSRSRVFTPLPQAFFKADPAISLRDEVLDPDESEALQAHIFSHGRVVASKETYNPTIGFVRRTYRYRRTSFFVPFSFSGWSLGKKSVARERFPFLTDYESDRYKGSLLALSVFRSRCGL